VITRLWFALSALWAGMMLWNYSTRVHPALSGFDVFFAVLPFIAGVLVRLIYRFVRFGPRLQDR
jgi:membrane protein implicated in regulation of membrane protease activity